MIDYFYSYIRNIILFLIFTSFIQVILPTNKYRSYINLILGMILVFIMIEPLNIIFDNAKNIETLTIFNEEDFKVDSDIDSEKYLSIQNDMVKNAFEDNIKRHIDTILKDEYFISDIEVSLYENKYKELNIESIQLHITKNNKNIYVKPFKEDKDIEIQNKKEIENITKLISELYNLDKKNIFITIT